VEGAGFEQWVGELGVPRTCRGRISATYRIGSRLPTILRSANATFRAAYLAPARRYACGLCCGQRAARDAACVPFVCAACGSASSHHNEILPGRIHASVLTISKAQKWPHCANFVPLQWTSASTIGNRATAAASDVHASLCCRDVLQGMMQKRGTSPLRLGRASIDVMLRLITRNAKIDDTVLHNWSPGSLALN